MAYAAQHCRRLPMVLALWPVVWGLAMPPAAAQPPSPAPLGSGLGNGPMLPEFPRLGGPVAGEAEREAGTNASANSWGGLRVQKVESRADVGLGQFSSQVVMPAPRLTSETPCERGEWSRADMLKLPLAGPLALFGQTAMNGNYAADQSLTVVGRTGAILKVPVWSDSALELRGGPAFKYNDALRPERTRDQGSVLLEVQARCPLLGGIGLEYTGAALPALTPLDRPKLDQSLGLAIPVSGGNFKLGAKHHWQQLPGTVPGASNMELFVGVELGR